MRGIEAEPSKNSTWEQIAKLRRGVRNGPRDPLAHLRLGLALLEVSHWVEATTYFQKAIALNPKLAEAHLHLGRALAAQGKFADAETAYRRAVGLDPAGWSGHLALADLLASNNRRSEAARHYEMAANNGPDILEVRIHWGKFLLQDGRADEAEIQARLAIEISSDESQALSLLAGAYKQRGRFTEAIEVYELCMGSQSTAIAEALHGITECRRITEDDWEMVDRMQSLVERRPISAKDELWLLLGLGKAFDDLGRYGEAMVRFRAAQHIAASRLTDGRRLDRAMAEHTVAMSKKLFPEGVYDGRGARHQTDLPVLIVGMPRSGTTLVEQILSSHPQVGAAGELNFWRESLHPQTTARLTDAKFANALAAEYESLLHGKSPGKLRVTDKMPVNCMLLGPIHLVVPNARIIHCQRHPVDTCLSILMNTLSMDTPPDYALDLEDLVFYYRCYQELMAHWRSILPEDRFFEVEYKSVVLDRDRTVRNLVQFCGLDWDDACLAHEKNTRIVDTPSKWQVRQPIYRTSLERWRRYEPWLGPLQDLMSNDDVVASEPIPTT